MPDAPSKPKLTFVIEGLVTAIGGAERVLCDVASALAEAGYDVDVVTHEQTAGPAFFPLSDKVRHIPLRPPANSHGAWRRYIVEPLRDISRDAFHALHLHRVPGLAWLGWYDRQGSFRRRLQRYFATHPRNVAIAFMPRAITALGLVRTDYPLAKIASTHTAPQRDFDEPSGDNLNVATRSLNRRALSEFDRITVLLDEFQIWYPPDLRARTTVIPNAIGQPRTPPNADTRENLILAIGRHLPVKGHDILIDAFAKLAADFPDWRVEIYGQGNAQPALQAQIATLGLGDHVRFMGVTNDPGAHYARAALLAHPSSIEGFSLVVAEALAASLPAIGFADCPGVNSLIRDGENGALVAATQNRSNRVDALAQTLGAIMNDPAYRKTLGQAGPASVAQYAPDKILRAWRQVIDDALACQRKAP